jgi:hypothetical protein
MSLTNLAYRPRNGEYDDRAFAREVA